MEVLSQEGCYPLEVTFGNQSVGGDTYTWNYGTGLNSQETAEEHTVAYFNPTSNVVTYTAVLTVSTDAGCSSQDVTYIEVLPEVEAHIEGGLSGCAPLEVDFLNLSDGAASYTWDFGDGGQSATTHANHIFTTDPGEDATYTVSLVAESVYGCTDTAQVSVQVFAAPTADFVTSSTQLTFPATTVTLSNTSTAGESADFYWTFGDGQVSYDAQPVGARIRHVGHVRHHVGSGQRLLLVGREHRGSNVGPHPHHRVHGRRGWMCALDGAVQQPEHVRKQLPLGVFRRIGAQRRQPRPRVQRTWGVRRDLVRGRIRRLRTGGIACCSGRGVPHRPSGLLLNPNHVMVPGQPVFFLNLSEDATDFAWDFGDGATSICRIAHPRIHHSRGVRRDVDGQTTSMGMFHHLHLA